MPTLRPYAAKDWPSFLALHLETEQDSLGEATDKERATLREILPAQLAHQGLASSGFFAPAAELLVLEGDKGEYLGHLWLTERHDAVHGKKLLEVTTMGIVRGARGHGYGRLLMQRAESQARARSIELIELSVAGNNRRARDLYRDLGYDTTRRAMRKLLR